MLCITRYIGREWVVTIYISCLTDSRDVARTLDMSSIVFLSLPNYLSILYDGCQARRGIGYNQLYESFCR